MVDKALRHRERAIPDVERQQQFTLRFYRDPHPLGRTRQALDGVGFTHLPSFDGTEERIDLIHLHLRYV